MDPVIQEFFDDMLKPVTRQHLVDFCPGDPGYEDYLRAWGSIVETHKVPRKSGFELSETIGLTGWADAEDWDTPERFREFRRFTSSVALMLIHQGNDSEIVRPANYLACDLLRDARRSDMTFLTLLREVFSATRSYLSSDRDPDFPFFRFGELILSDWLGDPKSKLVAASALLNDEQFARTTLGNDQPDFLLGLTVYDQFHDQWTEFARDISKPNSSDDLKLVIDSIVVS